MIFEQKFARYVDQQLKALLTPELRAALDELIAQGADARTILARAKEATRGKRTLAILMIESYLGADQAGNIPPKQ